MLYILLDEAHDVGMLQCHGMDLDRLIDKVSRGVNHTIQSTGNDDTYSADIASYV